MAFKRVEDITFREFAIIVGQSGNEFVAIGYDKNRKEIARSENGQKEQVIADVKASLLPFSADFVDIAGAINIFHKAFPDGFEDAFYLHNERNYKTDIHGKVAVALSQEAMDTALAEGRHGDVAKIAVKFFSNLVSPFEAVAIGNAIKPPANAKAFAQGLRDLLHGDDFDQAFDRLVPLLKPFNAAKWPLLTFWPFAMYPEAHGFLKPEPVKLCADRLGFPFEYEVTPSAKVYRQFMTFMDWVRQEIVTMHPRDFIDIQTFVYGIGSKGFIQETLAERAKWETT